MGIDVSKIEVRACRVLCEKVRKELGKGLVREVVPRMVTRRRGRCWSLRRGLRREKRVG